MEPALGSERTFCAVRKRCQFLDEHLHLVCQSCAQRLQILQVGQLGLFLCDAGEEHGGLIRRLRTAERIGGVTQMRGKGSRWVGHVDCFKL